MVLTFNFTVKALKALKIPTKGRQVCKDTKTKYLQLTLRPSGLITFYYVRKLDGKMKWEKLDTFPDMTIAQARQEVAKISGRIATGGPVSEKKINVTIKDLWTLYSKYGEKHRSAVAWRNAKYLYEKHCKRIENLNMKTLTTHRLNRWHGSIKGKVAANRAAELIRTIINWAINNDRYEGVNPASKMKLHPEGSRARFMDRKEIERFFKHVEDSPLRDFFLLLLFTGARRSNVQAMRWKDIDLEQKTWTVKVKQSINPVQIVLVNEAIEIIKNRKQVNAWVFPAHSKPGHLINPRKAWANLCKAAKLKDLHMHDLRRTLGSWQAAMGASLPIIGKSLGHRSLDATAVYARLNLDPIHESVQSAVTEMLQYKRQGQTGDTEPAVGESHGPTEQ